MNFDFSDELKQLRDQARRFLSEQCPPALVRRSLDGEEPYAAALWQEIAAMGWIGAAIPEQFGGAGLGYEGLCVLAEEIGRAVAPVPFASTAYLAAEAIQLAGTDAQKRQYLPQLADGSLIGCFAWPKAPAIRRPDGVHARIAGGQLSGTKWPVADGGDRRFRRCRGARRAPRASHCSLSTRTEHHRATLRTVDPSRDQARLDFAARRREQLPAASRWATGAAPAGPRRHPVRVRAGRRRRRLPADGAAITRGTLRLRPPDRLVPGDQAQAGRRLCRDRAGPLQRLLRRLGAWRGCRRTAAGRRHRAGVRDRGVPSGVQGKHPDPWRHRLYLGGRLPPVYRRSKHLALRLGGPPFWKDRLVDLLETRNAA